MTKEEARNVFGGSIVNNLLSLGAEPTNVVRQDGLIEWKSDGYIEVGGVQVWLTITLRMERMLIDVIGRIIWR